MVRLQLTDQAYQNRILEKPFLYIIVKLHPFLNSRLFLYFTSSHGEFYIFHLYLVAFIFIISLVSTLFSCQQRLLLSADNFCKQFVPRSVLTERRSWSEYRPFDTLIVFLKDALKKLILKKKVSRWQHKYLNHPACKELLHFSLLKLFTFPCSKLKERRKKRKQYWTRTHIFWVQRIASYPLGYRQLVFFHS